MDSSKKSLICFLVFSLYLLVIFFCPIFFLVEKEYVYIGEAKLVSLRPSNDPYDSYWVLSFDNGIVAYCAPNYIRYSRLQPDRTYIIKVYHYKYVLHPEDSDSRLYVDVYPIREV